MDDATLILSVIGDLELERRKLLIELRKLKAELAEAKMAQAVEADGDD